MATAQAASDTLDKRCALDAGEARPAAAPARAPVAASGAAIGGSTQDAAAVRDEAQRACEQSRTAWNSSTMAASQHSGRAPRYAEADLARRKTSAQAAAPGVSPEPVARQR